MRTEPTDQRVAEVIAELRQRVRRGWTPPLRTRLELGLTQDLIRQWRDLPDEVDVVAPDYLSQNP